MQRVFQRFVERLNDSCEPAAFRQAMAEASAAFDLRCFAYLRMPRDSRAPAALISSYPHQWTDHYLARHYERIDPVIKQAHSTSEPFEWGENVAGTRGSPLEGAVFAEARAFGINCGFTIPIQDNRGPVAAVTFASDVRRPDFERVIGLNRRALQLMAISLHAHVRRKLWQEPRANGVKLSPRELECLHWAAQGKSAWDIATILGISERTVVFHFENAKHKMNVRTLRQAIAILCEEYRGKS